MSDYNKTDIGSGYNTQAAINTELGKIETAVNSKVDKSGSTMTGDLDMNSNDILNTNSMDVQSLSINGTNITATGAAASALPDQSGNSAKVLSTNGSTAAWVQGGAKTFDTAANAKADTSLKVGEYVKIMDRAGSIWEVIAATGTENEYNTLQGTGSSVTLDLDITNKTVQAEAVGITTALADCKAATEAVLALSEINEIIFGYGSYAFTSLQLVDSQVIRGQGRENTTFTFSGTLTQDGITYSFGCNGGSSPTLADLNQVHGIEMDFSGATGGQGWYITKKVFANDLYLRNADANGIYFRSVNQNLEAPYFCDIRNTWSKSNGASGVKITENCNQNNFFNCQFDSNQEHGLHAVIVGNGQPTALYGNTMISGQTSYNELHGTYYQSGSEYTQINVYQEFNSQTDGGNPKTGAYKNTQLGSTVTRCNIQLGSQGTSTDIFDAIGLNTVTSNKVHIGNSDGGAYGEINLGYENVGSGRDIVFNGAASSEHNIYFREGTSDVFRIQYNGTPASPSNELLIQSYNSSTWTTVVKLTNNGRISFFDATTVAQQAHIADPAGGATVDAEARTAIDAILVVLENYGLTATS